MWSIGRYLFKLAETDQEMEEIHRLNYRTFVHEIRQYRDDGSGKLVDKFHSKNIYFIVLREGRLVGMLSAHDQPPFSVAERLDDPAVVSRPDMRPLEVRLLAVEPEERHGIALAGLVWTLFTFARRQGYTHMLISGVTDQVPLYEHLGFEALGPAVGNGAARFVPMAADLNQMERQMDRAKKLWEKRLVREGAILPPDDEAPKREPVNLLPGPVTLTPAVRAAIAEPSIYHRGEEFLGRFERLRRRFGEFVGGRDVAVLVGSGTLANEAVAATLAAHPLAAAGLMLVNGEFGRRLARQAERFGLTPRVLEWPWGVPWQPDEVTAALDRLPPGGWVWGVHQESSTGVLNDLPGLIRLAKARGVRVCIDCVSSIGAVPLDLREVYLATGASGKALGSYAGLALVFADAEGLSGLDTAHVPSYLDIPATLASTGPRFTVPSPLLRALEVAMEVYSTPEKARARYAQYAELGRYARVRLREVGLPPIADEACSSPVITTFAPPGDESAAEFVARCQSWGYLVGGQSGYLADQRLVQIANMGEVSPVDLAGFFDRLARALTRRTSGQESGVRSQGSVVRGS